LANTLSVQNSSDTTFTNRDIMKFASDLFSVSDDGVSKTLIDLNKASQLIAEDETTVNNAMIMTAIRTWQAINRVKAIANSWAQLQTFTSGAKLSNLAGTKTRPLSVDMNGNIIEGIENYAYQASININTEFPLLADVKKGYWYNVINTVTDNAGGGRTNTGQSFVNLDEIYWNGVNWSIYDEKILLSQNKYWVGNNLNAPTERTVALSKNIIGTDNLGNLQQAALTAACYWLGVAGVPTERTLALAKNLLKSDVNGNIAQATLSQNYFWMGDVNNIPSEVASTNALSDSGTLVAGTLRIDDTNISILSEALMGVSSSGQLNGKLTFTAYNQYMIFSSTDNTDTVRFRYVIFI